MNVRYVVKPGKENRILEILQDIRSGDTDNPNDSLRKELLSGVYSIGKNGVEHGSDHHDYANNIWALLETPVPTAMLTVATWSAVLLGMHQAPSAIRMQPDMSTGTARSAALPVQLPALLI